jgi:outer membrane protein OmpA-like peptidoglycan-associated protein
MPILMRPTAQPFAKRQRSTAVFFAFALPFALSACNPQPNAGADEPVQQATKAPTSDETPAVSILRPEIERPEVDPTPVVLEPLELTIGFPEGGTRLDADAVAVLEAILSSDQLALGGPITLGAHTDSAGRDKANLDASEARGLAVADWLIDQGVAADRITVIAFGEQNPIESNALPDGSPNEEGRAANRRVEVLIQPLRRDKDGEPETPVDTSVETSD